MSTAQQYVRDLKATLDTLPFEEIDRVIDLLQQARMHHRQVFIMGNGGSAATASHFVCDLGKNTRHSGVPHYRVIGLTDNNSMMTALANDEGYENVFVQQLENLLNQGDVVIAISASGNSMNVLKAVDFAREMQAVTIGFTGYDGGKLGQMVDLHVHVKSNCIEHVEDIHLVLEHIIIRSIKELQQPVMEHVPDEIVRVTETDIAH